MSASTGEDEGVRPTGKFRVYLGAAAGVVPIEPTVGGRSGESSGCGVTAAVVVWAPTSLVPARAAGAAASTRTMAVEANR